MHGGPYQETPVDASATMTPRVASIAHLQSQNMLLQLGLAQTLHTAHAQGPAIRHLSTGLQEAIAQVPRWKASSLQKVEAAPTCHG